MTHITTIYVQVHLFLARGIRGRQKHDRWWVVRLGKNYVPGKDEGEYHEQVVIWTINNFVPHKKKYYDPHLHFWFHLWNTTSQQLGSFVLHLKTDISGNVGTSVGGNPSGNIRNSVNLNGNLNGNLNKCRIHLSAILICKALDSIIFINLNGNIKFIIFSIF